MKTWTDNKMFAPKPLRTDDRDLYTHVTPRSPERVRELTRVVNSLIRPPKK